EPVLELRLEALVAFLPFVFTLGVGRSAATAEALVFPEIGHRRKPSARLCTPCPSPVARRTARCRRGRPAGQIDPRPALPKPRPASHPGPSPSRGGARRRPIRSGPTDSPAAA